MLKIIKFWFRNWKHWKGNDIKFKEAYEWHNNDFSLEEAKKWSYSVFGTLGHCSPSFATSARMFGLTPEEAIERYKKWLGAVMAKPISIHLEYRGQSERGRSNKRRRNG